MKTQSLKEKLRLQWRAKFKRRNAVIDNNMSSDTGEVIGNNLSGDTSSDTGHNSDRAWVIAAPTLSFDGNTDHSKLTESSAENTTTGNTTKWALEAPKPSFMQDDTEYTECTPTNEAQDEANYNSIQAWALEMSVPSFVHNSTVNTPTKRDTSKDSPVQTWLPATILVGGDYTINPWSSPCMTPRHTNALHIQGHHQQHHNQYTTLPIHNNIQSISPIKNTRIEAWEGE